MAPPLMVRTSQKAFAVSKLCLHRVHDTGLQVVYDPQTAKKYVHLFFSFLFRCCPLRLSLSSRILCCFGSISSGSSVSVTGVMKRRPQAQAQAPAAGSTAASTSASNFNEFELHASRVAVVGACDGATYPLAKKRHTLEHLREHNHLRFRSNTLGAVLRVRHAATRAIHQFFDAEGFVSVHTPILTPLDCEGAGELFRVVTPAGGCCFCQSSPPLRPFTTYGALCCLPQK
jgi:aspartyl/asparaginyl-tRNA synthetase